jgi:pantothenate kinase
MATLSDNVAAVTTAIDALPPADRHMIGVAGPPGAGKSTLVAALAETLAGRPGGCRVVPMDGFHLDNAILDARGQRPRKGSPRTFDALGFRHLLDRLRRGEEEVFVPVFDRDEDLSRNAADVVPPETALVLAEGNYLLLDRPPWDALAGRFHLTVFLDVPTTEVERRMVARWEGHGWPADKARAHIARNDLPNAQLVLDASRRADITLR